MDADMCVSVFGISTDACECRAMQQAGKNVRVPAQIKRTIHARVCVDECTALRAMCVLRMEQRRNRHRVGTHTSSQLLALIVVCVTEQA